MKLYSNIPQLFYGQLKIGLYNTDMSGKERIKEKKMINIIACIVAYLGFYYIAVSVKD